MAHSDNPKNEEHTSRDVIIYKSELEDIDFSVYNFVNDRLDIFSSSNEGFKKVPVVWAGAERAFSAKNETIERDNMGMVKYPIIVVERETVKKTINKRTLPYAMVDPRGDIKGGAITINKVIKQDKTSNFANADAYRRKKQLHAPLYRHGDKNKKIVYETITIPLPIYVDINYKIHLKAEYQEQMNDMLTPFARVSNAHHRVILTHNHNQYEGFIGADFGVKNTIVNYESNERKYEATVPIEVIGYLIGDGKNQTQPRVVRRENAVQIRFARERVIMDPDNDGDFRF
tara:strand:- start:1887 stop:2747 length:861 start_codon:yes stop_codon:yes gene_type:complete